MQVAAWYRGTRGPKFTKYGNLYIGQTPNHAKFIAVGQTVYQKSVTSYIFTPFTILTPQKNPLGRKFTVPSGDV